jgi:hypothetical protein
MTQAMAIETALSKRFVWVSRQPVGQTRNSKGEQLLHFGAVE